MKYFLFKKRHEPHPVCQLCNRTMTYIIVRPNPKGEAHYICQENLVHPVRCPNNGITFAGRSVKEIEDKTKGEI